VAVADPRTSSVVVTASKDLMDQIQGVIAELDPDDANTRSVAVFRVQYAEPQEALQVVQDLFNKNGTQNNRNNASATQNNALQSRSTTQNQQNNTGSRTTSMTPNSRGGGVGGGSFGQ